MGWLARLPIRLRLTLAFAVAMAVVLVAAGLFLYLRLGAALDRTIDRSLLGRADDVTALVRAAGSGLRQAPGPGLVEQEESFAQVLAPDGAVLDSTPGLRDRRLLSGPELARATRTIVLVDRPPFPDSDDPLRLLATPVQAEGGPVVVVVGTSTEERVEALESLLRQLLLGGPIVLAVASLLGYGLAAAALRPVESMRREAEAVSATAPGRRLPLPQGDDEIVRLGATLNTMLDRLEAALARERRFVSDASHELRTPLAALRTELELALRRPRPAAELEAALRSAAEETERLSRLAEDLLVLVRADGGASPSTANGSRRPSFLPGSASATPPRPPRPARRSRSRPTGWSWSPTVSAPNRPSATWSITPCVTATARCSWPPCAATAGSSSTSATGAPASRPSSWTSPSTASPAPTPPAMAPAPGSAWPSSRSSPTPTAAPRMRPTGTRERTCGSSCPTTPGATGRIVESRDARHLRCGDPAIR